MSIALLALPDWTVLSMALAGLVFGLMYFAALRRTVVLFVAGRGWFAPLALSIGRVGAAVVFLAFAARLGVAALLLALLGFLLARAIFVRATRSPA